MASLIRLFVEPDLRAGVEVALTGDQQHYLTNVMRRREGDVIAVFNGRDGEWRASLVNITKKSGMLLIEENRQSQIREPDLWLVFALLKRGPIEMIAEKAAELGVSKLCPVFTERTNTTRLKMDRLHIIATEAAEQCGRLTVPEIDDPQSLETLLSAWPSDRGLVWLDETGSGAPIADVMLAHGRGSPDALLIGPEGGFSPRELVVIGKKTYVTPTSMGKRLLRAETACIAALSTWQALAGDWRDARPTGLDTI
ncbi:MAG: 16S rRNA (uracil(1498)-N(3))-methyltransferase [Rhodospirillales bacterium]|nr:16S rRNA (uracil(1498)-N(3))-methyltransferase [Rhodospirillales bacterium]